MTNLSEKFAGLAALVDQVEQLQAASNTTLAAILAALGAQPNTLPVLQQIATTLDELLVSVRRLEQFVAPAEQTAPTGTQAGMAYELARLALVLAGAPGSAPGEYALRDLLAPLAESTIPNVQSINGASVRLMNAIWPITEARPGEASDQHRSIYWLLYRMLYWTSLEYPAVGDAKNTITSLYSIDDRLAGLYMLSNLIRQNLGDKVNNLTAIDYLAHIADCSCSGEIVPPEQNCANPVVSTGVREFSDRNVAIWSSNHQAFFSGALVFPPDTGMPDGATLSSESWNTFMVFVASRNAAYWRNEGDEVGALYPTNKWLQMPFSNGTYVTFGVPAGGEIVAYFCAGSVTQPPPVETGWTRLYSVDGVIYKPEGEYHETIQTVVGYDALGLTARDLNTDNQWRLVAPGGAIVDLAQEYEFMVSTTCNQFGVFGVGRIVSPGVVYTAGPQLNFALGTGGSISNVSFYVDIRLQQP